MSLPRLTPRQAIEMALASEGDVVANIEEAWILYLKQEALVATSTGCHTYAVGINELASLALAHRRQPRGAR